MLPVASATRTDTLLDRLEQRASVTPDARLFTWWDDRSESVLTYAGLVSRARIVAAHIREQAESGARVLLLYPPGLDFVIGVFGCFYAGVVAVPAYPPHGSRGAERLRTLIADSGAILALTGSAQEHTVGRLLRGDSNPGRLRVLCLESSGKPAGGSFEDGFSRPNADSLALLQYTSGSTGTPLGVMVSHENLLANCAVIHKRFQNSAETRGFMWLPPYHDMGLVGGILEPVFSGIEVILMAPTAVVQQPLRWLRAISRFRATVSGGPNFAYELCVRRIKPGERQDLDLSSWKVAFTGAEPINAGTLTRFAEAFADSGFDAKAIYPCYGLAESTLFVTGGPRGGTNPGSVLVACGTPADGHSVVIVDPDTRLPREEGAPGEIWIQGPSVARGYWQRTELNRDVFQAYLQGGQGPFLRSGDLGFLHEGRLYVSGRLKDLLVLRGRNIFPQDIEATVERSHEAVQMGGASAFTIEVDGESKLALLAEVHPRWAAKSETIVASVRRSVTAEHGVTPHIVILVRPGGIPRTSSGKVQRFACRRAYQENTVTAIAVSVAEANGPADAPSAESLKAMPVAERTNVLERYLVESVAARTGVAAFEIDPTASLLALGLDSLAMAALRNECEERWNAAPGLSDLLGGAMTLRTLAAGIGAEVREIRHVPASRQEPLAQMTEGQRGLWALQRAKGDDAGLTLARAFGVRNLRPVALRRALGTLLARHAALRSCFPEHAGSPRVADRGGTGDWFQEIDSLPWTDGEVARRVEAEAVRPFDLSRGPLFRVALFARPAGEWILLVQAHHIVFDFESLRILIAELNAAYAEVVGKAAVLPPPGDSYAVFAAEERARMEAGGPASERALQHWREHLGTGGPHLRIPNDAATGDGRHAGRTFFAISPETVRELRSLAAKEQFTPYVMTLTAWAAVLHQVSAQSEILVGCPVSNRPSARFARTVGYFVNLLPVRFSFSHDPPLLSLLRRTQQQWRAALEHSGYPFRRVIEELRLLRGNPLDPLFETLVSWNTVHGADASAGWHWALGAGGDRMDLGDPPALSLESIALPPGVAQVPLALSLVDTGDSAAGSLEYRAGLLSAAAAENLCRRLVQMLSEMPRLLARPVSRIALFLPGEREHMAGALNAAGTRTPSHETIADWWREAAEEHSDRTALVFPGGSLTFRELDDVARGVAAQLLERGLQPEEYVGVFAERKPETIAAILGVLLAGGVYVPLDPGNPTPRALRMIESSGMRRMLASADGTPPWPHTIPVQTVSLSAKDRATLPEANKSARSAAYAIFTSGSTGEPKAVVVEHGSLCNLVMAQIEAFGILPGWVVAQCAPFGFDASISEIFVTLLAGATLRLAGAEDLLVGDGLARFLRGATAVTLNPWVLASMGAAHSFPALQTLVVAGESCPDSLVSRWAVGRRFINAYGPTEATVCATLGQCASDTKGNVIGRPILNGRTYVLNAALEPVPVGAVGELFIGGAGVARGYLGLPHLTAERFLPDPFADVPGARMYRTGDLAWWRADGSLQFAGRIDDQVKIHGIRVEPGEIEAALACHPALRGCAVVAEAGQDKETRLLAYYEAAAGTVPPAWEFSAHLRTRLPAALIPAVFVPVDSLPRKPNGKLDRAALPAARPAGETIAAAGTSMERLVAEVWREVIGVDSIGADDNFFEAGGTSLSAGRVQAQLQERLGRTLPLVELFTYSTVRALAARLEQGDTAMAGAEKWRQAAAKARRTTALIQHVNSGGMQ